MSQANEYILLPRRNLTAEQEIEAKTLLMSLPTVRSMSEPIPTTLEGQRIEVLHFVKENGPKQMARVRMDEDAAADINEASAVLRVLPVVSYARPMVTPPLTSNPINYNN